MKGTAFSILEGLSVFLFQDKTRLKKLKLPLQPLLFLQEIQEDEKSILQPYLCKVLGQLFFLMPELMPGFCYQYSLLQ